MKDEPEEAINKTERWVITSVLLFWVSYVTITLAVGFVTSMTIKSEIWQLIAWGLISSAALLALTRFFMRIEKGPKTKISLAIGASSVGRFAIGFLVGAASFGIHIVIISTFAGPIRFEVVSGVGAVAALIYFTRFFATSCMEEIGFRGYTLQRLAVIMGTWPAVGITAVVFGLSHLLYGWSLQTIALGVVPFGFLWGMSAIATRGLAVPIGLHAAWNFTNWMSGGRKESGLLTMIIEDDALELTQTVGFVSYELIIAALTLAFWFMHRRNAQRDENAHQANMHRYFD